MPAVGTYVSLADFKTRTGITAATDDTLISQICAETNQWIESYTGRVLSPVASAVYLFDGYELSNRYIIDVGRLGARAVTLLETGTDGITFTTLAATEYALRPLSQYRALPGEPATSIYMTNRFLLPLGWGNIRVTMTAGFEAVPDDVRGVAIAIAVRAWHGRQSGMADVVGSDTTGSPIVSKVIAPEFKHTLDKYRAVLVA